MKPVWAGLAVSVGLAMVVALAGCAGVPPGGDRASGEGAGTVAGSQTETDSNVLYVNLMWHQHQPLYYQDPATGIYSRPWVRVHATKSYYDMAAMLREYPQIRATFNLTPVLLRQIDDFVEGARDIYWVLSEKHPRDLTLEERQFVLERFFDANHTHMIGRYPRYTQLLSKREQTDTRTLEGVNSWSERELMDLQVLFNLVWFDPDFLEEPPLQELARRGRDYRQEDKQVIFRRVREIVAQVVPIHRELQETGQIEVTTTPYAHPILPLIFSTNLAAQNDPTAELPLEFYYPGDAVAHLQRSVELYRGRFGRDPVGLWPAEGAVAQQIIKMVGDAGFQWMASGEQVLARSLGINAFARDGNDVVVEADALYRPYIVQAGRSAPVSMVFRDLRLSDLIGFEYSGTPAEAAAADLMARLEQIRTRLIEQTGGTGGPHLVSIILDGENAWEHYPNDGKDFLHAMYRSLSESTTIRTVTVSDFLQRYPEQRRIERLWPGSWFSPDFSTWIGEREETRAWEMLRRVREHLALYDMHGRRATGAERLERALDYMYLAQGSDWFWWFGDDQDSGQDEYFDVAFRELLKNVYRALGDEVPRFLEVPVVAERPAPPQRQPEGLFTPVIDGSRDEVWDLGGYHRSVGGVQARGADIFSRLSWGFDSDHLYILLETSESLADVLARGQLHLYLGYPGQVGGTPFVDARGSRLVGFDAAGYLRITDTSVESISLRDGVTGSGSVSSAAAAGVRSARSERVLEIAIPLAVVGDPESGDEIFYTMLAVEESGVMDAIPTGGPGRSFVPELGGGTPILVVHDPPGDDHGPGTYHYPTDRVFSPGSFDLLRFAVEEEERYLKFVLDFAAPVQNPWGSGINLSVQTVDIYVDVDPGAGTGARDLLEGRNASMPEGYGWEYALWIEGWNQKIFVPGSAPTELPGSPLRVRVDGDAGRIIVRMPRELLSAEADPTTFGYTAVVLGQEGFPSPGVRRVRDIRPSAGQWVFGGAPGGSGHTRIIDMAVPTDAAVSQEQLLSVQPGTPARVWVNTVDR